MIGIGVSWDNKNNRIVPRHVQIAVRNDEELSKLLGAVTIANGGVLPNIHQNIPSELSIFLVVFAAKEGWERQGRHWICFSRVLGRDCFVDLIVCLLFVSPLVKEINVM